MNYRKYYEEQTGQTVPKGYEVHHINKDRGDNRIENLVALPVDLHCRLHGTEPKIGEIMVNVTGHTRRGIGLLDYQIEQLQAFRDNYYEACEWVDYRDYLLGIFPNIHSKSY
jgi:hypothetical protein